MSQVHKFSIVTPTHNRSDLLPRLYDSIKRQTYKDFVWIIVNDGSVDDTDQVVQSFIDEKVIDIVYYKQPASGKPYALRKGFELSISDYIVDIDDDDELVPECLEVYAAEWKRIDEEGNTKIGSIRALTIDENGDIVGGKNEDIGQPSFDSNYLETHMSGKKHWENLTCFKSILFDINDIFDIKACWNGERINFVTEGVFWSRLARKTETRYIFRPLRIYHYSSLSISRHEGGKNRQQLICIVYSSVLNLNENADYWLRRPILNCLKTLLAILVYTGKADLSRYNLIASIKSYKIKILLYLCLPFSTLAGICYSLKGE